METNWCCSQEANTRNKKQTVSWPYLAVVVKRILHSAQESVIVGRNPIQSTHWKAESPSQTLHSSDNITSRHLREIITSCFIYHVIPRRLAPWQLWVVCVIGCECGVLSRGFPVLRFLAWADECELDSWATRENVHLSCAIIYAVFVVSLAWVAHVLLLLSANFGLWFVSPRNCWEKQWQHNNRRTCLDRKKEEKMAVIKSVN